MTSETPHTGGEGDESMGDSSSDPPEQVSETESVSPSDGGNESATNDRSDSQQMDGGGEEDVVTEPSAVLDPDVYRKPFAGCDPTDPISIANTIEKMDHDVSAKVREIHRLNNKLEKEVRHLQEKVSKTKQELKQFRERKNNETEEIKETATKEFIKDVLPIRDNLDRALDQDSDEIRSGIQLVKEDFNELLESEGVTIIEPESGDTVDPEIHEVMTRVQSDHEDGVVVECFRPGYSMDGYVIRPARVTVSDES